ncbi:Ig-like domain-containing protein [Salmonella enterica]
MSSLILYTGANYTGTSLLVTHGQTGELASAGALDYLSAGVNGMQAFCWSAVSTTAATDYRNHVESIISASIADLSSLYPQDQTQYPMSYLGIDPAVAVPVWLDMSQVSGSASAVASSSLVGGSSTSVNTLSLTGNEGVLAFIGVAGGSSVVATCSYGSYDAASGQVDWTHLNAGTVVLEYTGGAVVLLSATGFPDTWSFAAPKAQADGSWVIAVSGTTSGNVISKLSASKETLINNGTDTVTLTATVTDGGTPSEPVSGISVNWSTALGDITPASSVTDAEGLATATLTDNGNTGATVVTASLDDGSYKDITITFVDDTGGEKIVSLSTDKDSIDNDGSNAALLTATVHNADGSVAEGVAVNWFTTLGSLNHKEQDTNSSGVSKAKLTGTGNTGTARVMASLNNGSYKTVPVDIVQSEPGLYIDSVTSNIYWIHDDGVYPALLSAVVLDVNGAPAENIVVHWSTTLGVLSDTAQSTDSSGVSSVILTDEDIPGTAVITATLDNGQSGQAQVMIEHTPDHTFYVYKVTADPTSIPNDGSEYSTLTAKVRDNLSDTCPPYVTVYWSTEYGELSAPTSLTDSDGYSSVEFRDYGDIKGEVVITASLANGLENQATVRVNNAPEE